MSPRRRERAAAEAPGDSCAVPPGPGGQVPAAAEPGWPQAPGPDVLHCDPGKKQPPHWPGIRVRGRWVPGNMRESPAGGGEKWVRACVGQTGLLERCGAFEPWTHSLGRVPAAAPGVKLLGSPRRRSRCSALPTASLGLFLPDPAPICRSQHVGQTDWGSLPREERTLAP